MVCTTNDFSQRGVGLTLPDGVSVPRGEQVQVSLFLDEQECVLPAQVVFSRGTALGLTFHELNLQQQFDLTRLTFSRADTWANAWGQASDTPLSALREVSRIGLRGIAQLARATLDAALDRVRPSPLSPGDHPPRNP